MTASDMGGAAATSRPLRVLHVSQPTTAGVPVVVRGLVADQVGRGWTVAVACPPDGDLPAWGREAGAEVVGWRASRDPGPTTLAETARLRRVIDRLAPDVVHLHSSKAGLAGRLAIRGRQPTVFQPHAWSFLAVKGVTAAAATAWERYAARWAHALAYVSEGERRIGADAGISGRWVATPNGVDLAAFPVACDEQRLAIRGRLGVDDGPLAVCVGRLCRQKGQDVLLRAWRDVRGAVPGAQLVLVGDGPDLAAITSAPRDGVRVAGWARDVRDWYAAADVVVVPSRWEAGLSLVAREAMATGRSVVVTDLPGVSEDLPADAGAAVPVDDPAALAAAVAKRLADPSTTAAEGVAGRRHAEQFFDVRRGAQRVADVYLDLLR